MAGSTQQMDGKKPDSEPAVFDSDLGDDWGEAFEAEDYLAPPAATSEDFFLDETTPPPPASAERGGSVSSPLAPPTPASTAAPKKTIPPPALFLATVTGLAFRVKNKLLALSPRQKAVVFGMPAVLLIAVLLIALLPPRKSPTLAQRPLLPPTTTEGHEPEPIIPPITVLPEEAGAPPNQQAEPPPPEEHAPSQPTPKTAGASDKLRKKWSLPNFFIPVVGKTTAEPTAFVAADLTLTLLLEGGSDLPLEKELFLRDTIYQFYHNQPLSELRRYSLARFDMNQNLGAWLKKAWPDLPLATIVFDHYAVQ